MKSFLLVVSTLGLLWTTAHAQSDPKIDDVFQKGRLPLEKKQLILASILSGAHSPELVSVPKNPADERLVNIWRGNVPEVSSEITSLSLSLKNPEGTPYSVHISYQPEHVVLRHSLPSRPELLGGIRFSLHRDRNTAIIVEGRANTNLGAIIGAAGSSSRAMLICPLDSQAGGQRAISSFSTFSFGEFSASFDVKARARGHVLTGVNEGAAYAYINTFGAVAPPESQIVTSQQRSPSVELSYLPSGQDAADSDSELNAIVTVLELTLPAGYRRQTVSAALVSLSREYISQPLIFSLQRRRLSVASPECILVYSDTFDTQSYWGK